LKKGSYLLGKRPKSINVTERIASKKDDVKKKISEKLWKV